MNNRSHRAVLCLAVVLVLASAASGTEQSKPGNVELARDGVARMPILVGSVRAPANELMHYLETITGAKVAVQEAAAGDQGIYVGVARDFPWLKLTDIDRLGQEGFVLRSDGQNLLLLGREAAGVQHAVTTLLQSLGCRWFFPGKTWEVVPTRRTLSGSWDERQAPSFPLQRKIWYGFGASAPVARDLADWERHNRMGVPNPVTIGHSWHGLDPKTDFARHPDWFAEVKGKRQPSKPCYSNPEVIERASAFALGQAAKGVAMISMTPPDGLGYCECPRCLEVCRGGKPYQEYGTTFAKRPDGVLVNVTSETLFAFINKVAEAVAKKYPKTLIGCYAYSAYSHPPSFPMHPSVFLQTTTAYRRTPLSLADQLGAFQKLGVDAGIRGYFSVYQWDWDYPAVAKGELMLPRLVNDLRFYHQHNVRSINAEASCNWAPRGLGYYVASQLMWNVDADPRALIADFYDKAFGPAALPMERYYTRWLGSYVAVHKSGSPDKTMPAEGDKAQDELGASAPATFDVKTLQAAFRDLDEAAALVKDLPGCRERVDHLRMYAHYLFLRQRLQEAGKTKDKAKILQAIQDETVFGARLMNTSLIHSRPLIGKEFFRRFQAYKKYLEGTPEWPQSQRDVVQKAANVGYRRARSDVPDRQELEKLWEEDKRALAVR